jgi:small conductance mechanosensitive channel
MVQTVEAVVRGAVAQSGGIFGIEILPEAQTVINEYVIPAAIFVLTLVVVWMVGRAVLVPAGKKALDAQGHHETVKSLGGDIIGAINVVLAFAIAFTVAGFGNVIAAFATIGGALALAVGFAAQDLLGNFVAGIFILKDKPFRVGDWIEVNDIEGVVTDIDLRVSRLRTFDNEVITVPNSELADNAVTNPVANNTLRQKFTFGIGYDDDIGHAREVILEEADKNAEILDEPGPSIRVSELADSYVGLQTRFWISDPSRSDFVKTRSDFVEAVKNRLDAEAIDMPYPHTQLTGGVELDGAIDTHEQTATASTGDD